MKVFWRPEPLNEHEVKLLSLCLEAHAQSALRQNVSSVVLQQAAIGSGDYIASIVAALSTVGKLHAPLLKTWEFMALNAPVERIIKSNIKVPGWGNSFEKDGDDPLWIELKDYLEAHFSEIWQKINDVTIELHRLGKKIFPNPSIFTVATGVALRMPPEILPWLFLNGRLNTWTAMFCNTLRKEGGLSA